jgi:hypothetical protein
MSGDSGRGPGKKNGASSCVGGGDWGGRVRVLVFFMM